MTLLSRIRNISILFVGYAYFSSAAFAGSTVNEQLLEAVAAGSLDRVEEAINAGADPNWYAGYRYEDKPLCLATKPGNEPILKALLAANADPNVIYYPDRDLFSADPLACAAHSKNLTAFKILHEAGVDLDRDLCPECGTKHPKTVLFSILRRDQYDTVRYLIENANITDRQVVVIARSIARHAVYADDKTLPDRDWIADWLRTRGHDVTPREPWPARK